MALVWLFLAVETAVAFGVALGAACWAQRDLRRAPRDDASRRATEVGAPSAAPCPRG